MRRLILLFLLCASLTTSSLADARERKKTRAHPAARAFDRGSRLFKQMDYQGAVEAFQRSYKLRRHFLTLCNMARCFARMNDMVKAAATYRRCLREGGGQSKMASRLSEDMAKVEARITTLKVESPGKGGVVYLNGRPVGPAPQTLSLNPGSHVIEVRRDGAQSASTTVETRGGERSVELTPLDLTAPEPASQPATPEPEPEPKPEPEPARSGLSSTWFWVGVGTTVGLAAAASVMGVLTNAARDDFDDGPTWDKYHRVDDFRLVTNILWGATAAVGATTTVLFFFTDFGGKSREVEEEEGAVTLGIGITGSF
jgi:hypothetical protein